MTCALRTSLPCFITINFLLQDQGDVMRQLSRRFLSLVTSCIIVLPAWTVSAESGDERAEIQRIIATARESRQVMEHLDYLANRIGPRLTGSDGLQNACEWARDRFQSFGLESRLEEWGEIPVGFNRGPWSGRVISPESRELEFGTAAWSAGTRGVVRGRAVLAPENDEQLAAVREGLADAWVFAADSGRPAAPVRGGQGQRRGGTGSDGAERSSGSDQTPNSQSP